MSKRFICILIVLVSVFSLSVSAFAASDDSDDKGGIFGGLSDVVDFIKDLFIPKPDYFHNKIVALNDKINDRLGGVGYLFSMLKDFFTNLNHGANTVDLKFTLPQNYFFNGYSGFSVDFFQSAKPYLKVANDVLTSAFCLFTAIVCYHKVRVIFGGSGEG